VKNKYGYTEKQVKEMIQEAVAKVEKSFDGTFKRLKADNELLTEQVDDLSQIIKHVRALNVISVSIKDLSERVQRKWRKD